MKRRQSNQQRQENERNAAHRQRQICQKSLESTLQANKEIQNNIRLQLQDLYQRKQTNRLKAANCLQHYQCLIENQGVANTEIDKDIPKGVPNPNIFKTFFANSKTATEVTPTTTPGNGDVTATTKTEKAAKATKAADLSQTDDTSAVAACSLVIMNKEASTSTDATTTANTTKPSSIPNPNNQNIDTNSVTDIANAENAEKKTEKKKGVVGRPKGKTKQFPTNLVGDGVSADELAAFFTYRRRKQYQYDPNRRQTYEYFREPFGSTPNPNEDLLLRKRKRQQQPYDSVVGGGDDGKIINSNNGGSGNPFFHYTVPPWTKHELNRLRKLIVSGKYTNNEGEIDWTQVATQLQEERTSPKVVDLSLPSAAKPRTAKECELTSRSLLCAKQKIPKTVMLSVLEKVHEVEEKKLESKKKKNKTNSARVTASYPDGDDDDGDDDDDDNATGILDWKCLAEEINGKDDTGGSNFTPWQLFTKYQQEWKTSQQKQQQKRNDAMWQATIEADEFLLRYLALQGPQFVWDKTEAAQLCKTMFPTAVPRQLIDRSKSHSVNPNMILNSTWTSDEERKLALLMKMYQNFPEPTIMAATHFADGREARQVSMKWERSLCPLKNNHAPFTKEEDNLILLKSKAIKAGKASGDNRGGDDDEGAIMTFADMAREVPLFVKNCRGPHQLWQRFKNIASPEEIATRKIQEQWRTTRGGSQGGGLGVSQQDFVLKVQARNKGKTQSQPLQLESTKRKGDAKGKSPPLPPNKSTKTYLHASRRANSNQSNDDDDDDDNVRWVEI